MLQESYKDSFLMDFFKGKNIAILGLSPDETKPSFEVGSYLKNKGYTLFPIYPKAKQILDFKVYQDLDSIPEKIDVLCIFRKSEVLAEVVKQALQTQKIQRIWVQLGLFNEEAKQLCLQAQIPYVQNRCMLIEHQRLFT